MGSNAYIKLSKKTNLNAKNLFSNARSYVANLFAPARELAYVTA